MERGRVEPIDEFEKVKKLIYLVIYKAQVA